MVKPTRNQDGFVWLCCMCTIIMADLKPKGPYSGLPFPHIQMPSFSNLYKGPTEVNNRLGELAFRRNCYMLASVLTGLRVTVPVEIPLLQKEHHSGKFGALAGHKGVCLVQTMEAVTLSVAWPPSD